MGRPCLRRGAHGRCTHPAPAQGAGAHGSRKSHRNCARRGLPLYGQAHQAGLSPPLPLSSEQCPGQDKPSNRRNFHPMTKTLISIGAWALLGWIIGAWLGVSTGWAVFSLGLVAMVLTSGLQLSRI